MAGGRRQSGQSSHAVPLAFVTPTVPVVLLVVQLLLRPSFVHADASAFLQTVPTPSLFRRTKIAIRQSNNGVDSGRRAFNAGYLPASFVGLNHRTLVPGIGKSWEYHPSVVSPTSLRSTTGGGDGENESWSKNDGGSNWIEKFAPTGIEPSSSSSSSSDSSSDTVDLYSLGISGKSFQTSSLSEKMYVTLMEAALKRFPPESEIPGELLDVYKRYAMDFTAREATKAALKQNGLDMVVDDEEMGMWGDIDSVKVLHSPSDDDDDDDGGNEEDWEEYRSVQEAVELGDWNPGETFDFVVTSVSAKAQEMDLGALLKALDPTGELRQEAKERGMTMPDEDLMSLNDLGNDSVRRSNIVPPGVESEVFSGVAGVRGYSVVRRGDLLRDSVNRDGSENRETLVHVMDSLVSHGALLVDLTDSGTHFHDAEIMSNMWKAVESFFETLETNPELKERLPPMQSAPGAGSDHAKIGYASYDEASLSFLETRVRFDDGMLLPEETLQYVLGPEGCQALKEGFKVIANVGKDVVRIVAAAASVEVDAFVVKSANEEDGGMPFISGLSSEDATISGLSFDDEEDDDRPPTEKERKDAAIRASEYASMMVQDLVDDGTGQGTGASMSPHRLCRYTDSLPTRRTDPSDNSEEIQTPSNVDTTNGRAVFGAHTDTSFATIVPVAAVSGLEVFDETSECWYRPEVAARRSWEEERQGRGEDPTADTEKLGDSSEKEDAETIPWHARYLVVMPGELLQLVSRNEVPASVHRVVAMKPKGVDDEAGAGDSSGGRAGTEKGNGGVRLSAPVLLRARSGREMDVGRYFGALDKAGPLLKDADGKKMEEIHDAMQPSSFQ